MILALGWLWRCDVITMWHVIKRSFLSYVTLFRQFFKLNSKWKVYKNAQKCCWFMKKRHMHNIGYLFSDKQLSFQRKQRRVKEMNNIIAPFVDICGFFTALVFDTRGTYIYKCQSEPKCQKHMFALTAGLIASLWEIL